MSAWIKDYWQIFTIIGAVLTSLGFGLTVLILVWRISRYFTRVETRIDGLDKRIDGLDKRIDGLDKRIDDVWRVLQNILGRLSGQSGEESVSTSQSPIRLTEYGTKLAGKSQAETIVETYADRAEVAPDMNEYQIQQTCFDFARLELLDILETTERDRIEKLAFDEGISITEISRVIGIKMRDYHLTKLGKNVGNIDQQTPD
ncbi:MAG: hypothetical protein OXT03_02630 [Alphaproteobacteria bacterium]|nr:hypothetical protein [Alphaproteobacteria bacterium]